VGGDKKEMLQKRRWSEDCGKHTLIISFQGGWLGTADFEADMATRVVPFFAAGIAMIKEGAADAGADEEIARGV
jgi:hypothetical protein